MTTCYVAIIGAGPYGLSIAAHLKARRVDFRILGSPMEFWLKHMPAGMHLKSEGFASSLYDPGSTFTLEAYCKERGLPYAHIGTPVPLETFIAYGLEFQQRFVPEVENEWVTSLQRSSAGFRITLRSGEVFGARRVVVAVRAEVAAKAVVVDQEAAEGKADRPVVAVPEAPEAAVERPSCRRTITIR